MSGQHQQDSQLQRRSKEKLPNNRRRFLKQGSLAAGVAAVFSFFGITPFSQVSASSVAEKIGDVNVLSLDVAAAQPYIRAVLASNDFQRFQQTLHQQHAVFSAQKDAAIVTQVGTGEQGIISVYVPVKGGAGHSFYSALLQPGSSTITQAQFALLQPADQHNTAVVAKRNGQIIFDGLLASDGTIIRGITRSIDGKQITLQQATLQQAISQVAPLDLGSWWNCFNGCCSSAGVPGVLIGLIGLSCTGACGVTLGLGCAICIVAVGGGYGSILGYCLAACG